MDSRIYLTQLIFLKDGEEDAFNAFEEQVLPLLSQHAGELLLRVRPGTSDAYIAGTKHPYEIHLVTFGNRGAMEAYVKDPSRTAVLHLKDKSVEKIMLIEGKLV